MSLAVAKPKMSVRLLRAAVWLAPAAALLLLRELLGVPDELLSMPASGIPPTRMDGLINIATAWSVWFGVQAFLASLVWDDNPELSALLVGIMLFQTPFVFWSGVRLLL
jgi:hypothetical protein